MNLADIAGLRLDNQHITRSELKTPKDLVGWMGAVQAQDYPMAKWALGVRLPNSTEKSIETAIDRGDIIRTHVLRPTWHFVTAGDLHWMLDLTAPRIRASMISRDKILGLTEDLVARSNRIIRKALEPDRQLSREKLISVLQKARIPTDNNRAWHLLLRAELDGIICGGAVNGKTHAYTLLEQRVPRGEAFTREESLERLARIYFSSHGPATLKDFAWWSGLTTTDARRALEMIQPEFVSETIGACTYWFHGSLSLRKSKKTFVHLLPAYDEFMVSYKDRSAAVDLKHQKRAVSSNGIFWPAIVINGRVSAVWKRALTDKKVVVEIRFLRPQTSGEKRLIQGAGERLGDFLGREAEIHYRTR